jgi:hypothetical protein
MVESMTIHRDSDHPRGVDGKFVNAPKAGVDPSTRVGLASGPVDAAGDDAWALASSTSGLPADLVVELKDVGVTPPEATDARTHRVDMADYVYSRERGAIHEQVVEAAQRGIDIGDYGYALEVGATHVEVLEADDRGMHIGMYGFARKNSSHTHEQVLAGWRAAGFPSRRSDDGLP